MTSIRQCGWLVAVFYNSVANEEMTATLGPVTTVLLLKPDGTSYRLFKSDEHGMWQEHDA